MIEDYLHKEMAKPVEANIDAHEDGGQFRIAFPYQTVRSDKALAEYMKKMVEAVKRIPTPINIMDT